jgi:hypothetical protein
MMNEPEKSDPSNFVLSMYLNMSLKLTRQKAVVYPRAVHRIGRKDSMQGIQSSFNRANLRGRPDQFFPSAPLIATEKSRPRRASSPSSSLFPSDLVMDLVT